MNSEFEFISFGKKYLSKQNFIKPYNTYINKPHGCLWACNFEQDTDYKSSWGLWCLNESFNVRSLQNAVLFNINKKAKRLIIDSYDDLYNAINIYEFHGADNVLPDFGIKCIDYRRIAKKYDLLELTERGLIETKYSHPLSLYAWDVSCVCILNYNIITNQKYIKGISEDILK